MYQPPAYGKDRKSKDSLPMRSKGSPVFSNVGEASFRALPVASPSEGTKVA